MELRVGFRLRADGLHGARVGFGQLRASRRGVRQIRSLLGVTVLRERVLCDVERLFRGVQIRSSELHGRSVARSLEGGAGSGQVPGGLGRTAGEHASERGQKDTRRQPIDCFHQYTPFAFAFALAAAFDAFVAL
jgi:hypothetical protein